MPALTRLPTTATAAQVIAVLERDGGVIVEAFLTAEQVTTVDRWDDYDYHPSGAP